MGLKTYAQVSKERYRIICDRDLRFKEYMNDVTKPPVKVFDPLSEHLVKELDLIREVSRDLQNKKEEDIAKAAQAAKQAEEEAAQREAEEKKKTENEENVENKDEVKEVDNS